jgi:multidrug efflux pump subunit AcrA (membrane-fusion protein)
MRRFISGLVILAIIIGGGAAVYWYSTRGEEADTAASSSSSVSTPTESDVNSLALEMGAGQVTAEGRIVPAAQASLAFQISGQIAELLVAEGDAVVEGTPLLRLDDTDQQLALQQAQAVLVQAEANLHTAEASLQQAQVGLETAELGITSAEVQLALLTADPTEAQIALQESQLAISEAVVNQAAGSRSAALEGASTAEIRSAEAQLLE